MGRETFKEEVMLSGERVKARQLVRVVDCWPLLVVTQETDLREPLRWEGS